MPGQVIVKLNATFLRMTLYAKKIFEIVKWKRKVASTRIHICTVSKKLTSLHSLAI
jgi:hypothetical protein